MYPSSYCIVSIHVILLPSFMTTTQTPPGGALPSKPWGKIMHLDIKGQNIMFQVSYKGAGIGAVDGARGVEGFVGQKREVFTTPLKINFQHSHGGLEDHFPF